MPPAGPEAPDAAWELCRHVCILKFPAASSRGGDGSGCKVHAARGTDSQSDRLYPSQNPHVVPAIGASISGARILLACAPVGPLLPPRLESPSSKISAPKQYQVLLCLIQVYGASRRRIMARTERTECTEYLAVLFAYNGVLRPIQVLKHLVYGVYAHSMRGICTMHVLSVYTVYTVYAVYAVYALYALYAVYMRAVCYCRVYMRCICVVYARCMRAVCALYLT